MVSKVEFGLYSANDFLVNHHMWKAKKKEGNNIKFKVPNLIG